VNAFKDEVLSCILINLVSKEPVLILISLICPSVLAEKAFNDDVLSSNLLNLAFCADCAASLD